MLLAELLSGLVGFQCAMKIVQTDQTDRHVVQSYANSFRVLVEQQQHMRALVRCQGFRQVSSTVKDVCDVDLQTRQPQILASSPENLSGSVRSRHCPIVLTQQG